MSSHDQGRHVAAVVGGAIAGSVAAEVLTSAGVLCVVLEQNDRPYGKIEDGLPRWHVKQRKLEYERIDSRLDHPCVHFLPRTRLGRDIDFRELIEQWGFSVVLLANGAWKDRPLPVEGIDEYVCKGLVYQNPLIYWFNHKNEKSYTGPRYEIQPGTIVIGGGLASIDVVKVIQFELYEKALCARGIDTSMLELEHKGVPAVCASHQIDPGELMIDDCTLYYRRRAVDMPLAQFPENASQEQIEKTQAVRKKILTRVMEKYRVRFKECHAPVGALVENGRLVGLRFIQTRVEGGKAVPLPGSELEVYTSLVVSSIGSIPELIPGIEMKGELYKFSDPETGEYMGCEGVFGIGNVVTGQGNIMISQKHSQQLSRRILENYLGLGPRDTVSPLFENGEEVVRQKLEPVKAAIQKKPPLSTAQISCILERVQRRQREIGYKNYRDWIKKVTPPDLE
ncbi:MAG: hypothetical protein HY645_02810 [Acidobacteria bacterium]|nr:hypothetical protein [Acidobacteriota bacterium]